MIAQELIDKYTLQDSDWGSEELDKVATKIKAETIVILFRAIENTLCELISPEESEFIDSTREKLLKYIDDNFLNIK